MGESLRSGVVGWTFDGPMLFVEREVWLDAMVKFLSNESSGVDGQPEGKSKWQDWLLLGE